MKKSLALLAALFLLLTCSACNPYPWDIGEVSSNTLTDNYVQFVR